MKWFMAILFATIVIGGLIYRRFGLDSDRATTSRPAEQTVHAADRQRITDFWTVYRRATDEKQAGRWEDAVADYRKSLELNPQHWDSLYYLGSGLLELRRYGEAEEAFKSLARTDGKAARANSALGSLYSNPNAGKLFDLKKAHAEFEKALSANGDESGPVLRMGEVALAFGDMKGADEDLAAAGRTNFRSIAAPFLRGYIAWNNGDHDRAAALFKQALDLTKEQKPPAGVLGEGDTKLPGHAPMVQPGQRGLFDGFIAELWKPESNDGARMQSIYQRMRRFIKNLPKKPA